MKIIFLDLDGVLNSVASYERHGNQQTFGEENVAALNHIIAETGANIVVTSAQRIGKMRVELRQLLKEGGVVGDVLDKTPYLSLNGERRGLEIQQWIKDCHKPIEGMVILDDSDDMNHLKPYLVQTSFQKGLTMEDAEKAIQMLMKKVGL